MRLVGEGRIVTLIQTRRSSKKDFGFIGFHPQPYAAFLAFPKPLKETDNLRVIGIKYGLLERAKVKESETFKPREPKLRVLAKAEAKHIHPQT